MNKTQMEYQVLEVVKRIRSGAKEDQYIEIKAELSKDIKHYARRIAGHCNSARGEQIMWLIGIDEEGNISDIPRPDWSSWFQQLKKEFDGMMPLITPFEVPIDDKTITALFIETDRAPYVVRNPNFGSNQKGSIEFEVPWREGTRTRTARREDLLRLLVPTLKTPSFEILNAELITNIREDAQEGHKLLWILNLYFYCIPNTTDRIVIPCHKCSLECFVEGIDQKIPFPGIYFSASSTTISAGLHELIISSPGAFSVQQEVEIPPIDRSNWGECRVRLTLQPADAIQPFIADIVLSERVHYPVPGRIAHWRMQNLK